MRGSKSSRHKHALTANIRRFHCAWSVPRVDGFLLIPPSPSTRAHELEGKLAQFQRHELAYSAPAAGAVGAAAAAGPAGAVGAAAAAGAIGAVGAVGAPAVVGPVGAAAATAGPWTMSPSCSGGGRTVA
jgi:hypothetical protein